MKGLKKVIQTIVCSSFAFFLFSNANVSAAEANGNSSMYIPEEMQPYSEIEYVSDNEFKIINGGSIQDMNQAEYNPSIPMPHKGMKVQYASDGRIARIENEDGSEPDYGSLLNLADSEITTYTSLPDIPIGFTPFAKWGSGNALYKIKGKIVGVGRATTFSDTIGQNDIRLSKGDVATKLAHDNCEVNTPLLVKANIKGTDTIKTVILFKRDAGGMPDAVLDIWKTGVEHWGYTWSTWFSMPNTVMYEHY